LIGVFLLSCSVIGWWIAYMSVWERLLLFVASLLLIEPRVITDVIAVVFIIPVLLYQLKKKKKIKS